MTPKALAARLRELNEKATPGPWTAEAWDNASPTNGRFKDGAWEIYPDPHDQFRIPIMVCDHSDDHHAPTRLKAQFDAQLTVTLRNSLPSILTALEGVEEMRSALTECVETLALAERVPFEDPDYGAEVRRLGERIGFGALMSTASASWAKVLSERGDPAGSQFVAGPCHATVERALKIARAALKEKP